MSVDTLPLDECQRPAYVAKAPVIRRKPTTHIVVKRKRLFKSEPKVEDECDQPRLPGPLAGPEPIEPAEFTPVPEITFEEPGEPAEPEGEPETFAGGSSRPGGPPIWFGGPSSPGAFASPVPTSPVPELSTAAYLGLGFGLTVAYLRHRRPQ